MITFKEYTERNKNSIITKNDRDRAEKTEMLSKALSRFQNELEQNLRLNLDSEYIDIDRTWLYSEYWDHTSYYDCYLFTIEFVKELISELASYGYKARIVDNKFVRVYLKKVSVWKIIKNWSARVCWYDVAFVVSLVLILGGVITLAVSLSNANEFVGKLGSAILTSGIMLLLCSALL